MGAGMILLDMLSAFCDTFQVSESPDSNQADRRKQWPDAKIFLAVDTKLAIVPIQKAACPASSAESASLETPPARFANPASAKCSALILSTATIRNAIRLREVLSALVGRRPVVGRRLDTLRPAKNPRTDRVWVLA